jgi:hypothetical protein
MTMLKQMVLCAVVVAACGGKKQPETTPDQPRNDVAVTPTGDQSMVPPETMDEIQRLFRRKGDAVSRCLSFAIDNKELPKNSHGKVTLGVTIGTGGKAGSIKVINATLESKSLTECVVHRVEEIQFPEVKKPYETTYTYAFEAS